MKIVNCALLYADGDKYVWSVVTEGASEFPIDMDLVADGSIWENDGVKSVLTDGSWVAESSGGEMVIPEVTVVRENGTYTSTVPFAEMLQLIENSRYQASGKNTYPAYFVIEGAFTDFAGMRINDGLIEAVSFAFHADGTITTIRPSA